MRFLASVLAHSRQSRTNHYLTAAEHGVARRSAADGRSRVNAKALIWNDPATLIISSPDLF
jgi:hypothetical protein